MKGEGEGEDGAIRLHTELGDAVLTTRVRVLGLSEADIKVRVKKFVGEERLTHGALRIGARRGAHVQPPARQVVLRTLGEAHYNE